MGTFPPLEQKLCISTIEECFMALQFVSSGGDPQVGNLATPINSSGLVQAWLNNLPAYRPGLTAKRRGLEVGMAHGYLIYGPFTALGPLRDTAQGTWAGLLSSLALVLILTICLGLYSRVPISKPIATFTTPNPPECFSTAAGWHDFKKGFFVGGCGGALVAYLLTLVLVLLGLL